MSAFRCGQVAILGRPNSGKSTLVNRLVGEKVSIVSDVPQTTRTTILGLRNEPDAQVLLVDTPGIHMPKHEMNRRMIDEAWAALAGVDAAVHVVDASDRVGAGDEFVASRLRQAGVPIVVALNKVDAVQPKTRLLPLMERFGAGERVHAVVPISALHGDGVDQLLAELRALLPEGPAVYPTDITTDQTERFWIAELIREKVLHATRQEVPHATAVLIEAMEEKSRRDGSALLVVHAALVVEKDNQKGILIGRGGAMLARIGTAARLDLEEQLDLKCHLELFVKVVPKWREKKNLLAELSLGHRGGLATPAAALLEETMRGHSHGEEE